MFQNPNTLWIEIMAIAMIACFLAAVIGVYAYKKAHHLPTGECACCHKNAKKLVKEYRKYYSCK